MKVIGILVAVEVEKHSGIIIITITSAYIINADKIYDILKGVKLHIIPLLKSLGKHFK